MGFFVYWSGFVCLLEWICLFIGVGLFVHGRGWVDGFIHRCGLVLSAWDLKVRLWKWVSF